MNFGRITGKSMSDKESSYKRINLEKTKLIKTNKISTQSFTLISIFPKTVLGLAHTPAFFWFLFLLSIDLTSYIKESSIKASIILPLGILFIKNFSKNCLILRSQYLHDKEINQKTFAVNQGAGFVSVKSEEIEEGDIVLVKAKETVPADALVIATDNDNNEFFVRNCDFDENNDLERKKAVKETQVFITEDGMSVTDVKKLIESIKIIQPNVSTEKVESKIKFKNNPRVVHTSVDSFVVGGSEIVDSEWILCLIVYVGFDTKKWINYKRVNPESQSRLDHDLNICLLINFIILVVFILLNCFLGVYFELLRFEDSSMELAFYSIAIYGNLVPVTLYMCLHIFKSISSIKLTVSNYPHSPSIINTNIVDDLGKVEYIITEQSGVLTDNQVKVQACLVSNCLYKEDIEDFHYDQNSNSDFNEDVNITNKSHESFEVSTFENLKNEIYDENCSIQKRLFSFCLALCNTYINDTSLQVTNNIDSALIEFSQSLGMSTISRIKNKVEVEFNSNIYKFSINALGSKNSKEINYKATIKDYSTKNVYLVYKVQSSILEPDETDEDYSAIQDRMETIELKKYQKIIFLYKKLKQSEIKKISSEYQEALQCKVNRKHRISYAFDNYKTNMNILGVVAYGNLIEEKTIRCVEKFIKSGIKIWISSSSSQDSLVSTAYCLNLIDPNTSLVQINNIKSVNEAMELVTSALQENVIFKGDEEKIDENKTDRDKKRRFTKRNLMKQQERISYLQEINSEKGLLSKTKNQIKSLKDLNINFAVCIGPDLLSLAFKSRELMKNLIMLLFTARTVIVHSANNELKMNLVRVVKTNLSFKPVVMAVGQGDKCFKMLNEASIGVKIDNKLSNWFFSDVKIENFCQLERVILDLGFNGYKGIKMIYLLFMFKQGMIGTLLFLFQSQCGYSACSMISFDLVVVYELLISFSFVLFSGIASRSKFFGDFEIRIENLFLDRRVANMIVSFVVGVVQGTLIMIFVVFVCYGIGDNGMTEDFDSVGLTAFIMVNLVFFAHGFVIFKSFRKLLWVALYCLVLLVIVLAVACNSNISTNYLSNSSFSQKPAIWFLIILYPFVGVIISFSLISFASIIIPMTPPRLIQYKKLEKVFCDSFHSFQGKEINGFALDNKTLKFKDVYQEAEFLQHMHQNSIFSLKLIFIIILILEVINNIFIAYDLIGFLDLKIYTIIITCFSFVLVLVGFFVLNEKRLRFIEMMSLAGILIFSIVETYVNTTISTIPRYAIFAALYSMIISTGFYWTIVKYIIIYFASIAVVVYETYVINYNGIAVHTSHWSIIMLFLLILLGLANYQQEKNKRKQYTFIKQAEIEVDKSSTILGYLLPEFVRKRVKDGARYISEDKGTVSILFCDIYDFDTIMNLYSPQELTYLMNDLFGRIDLICENFGVAKIETVGKTYLACAGLKDSEVNIDPIISKISHARRAVELGLTILKESEKIVLKNGQKIKFKIGVNSGPVTAGVVGFHKPQFSLVGDTVNTASRMASTLKQADAVQISLNTYELLGSTHGLKFNDFEIDVKGKGNMETKVVSFIEQSTSDNNGEELTSIQGNLASPLKSSLSSPTLHSIHNRQSENLTIKNQNRLSNILEKLGIKNTEELVNKQTNRSVQGIFNILCKETEEEKKLRLNYIEEISKTQKIGLLTSVTCDSLLILAEIIYYILELEHSSLPRLLIIAFGELVMIFFIYLKPKCDNKISFALALSSLYTLEFIGIFISEFFAERSSIIQYMYFVYKFTLLNFFSGTFFGKNLYFNFVLSSMWIADTLYRYPSLPSVTYTVSYLFIVLFSTFSDEQRLRMNTILKLAAEKEINQTQQLLTHMMPPNALANFEEGTQVMDRLTQVTVMYADIVGFTAWSSIRSPREVVGMLSELFTRFDKQCIENNVYKVHTIGDCYVAMGYINDKNRNPAKEAVNMLYFAHSLIGIISETNEKCGIKLGMRIGIHTGEITGGITGTKIVRYDIYGPHVMIANKMESSGKEGNVAVSESTKELIDNYKPNLFSFTKAKEVYLDSLSQSINLYFADLTEAAPNN